MHFLLDLNQCKASDQCQDVFFLEIYAIDAILHSLRMRTVHNRIMRAQFKCNLLSSSILCKRHQYGSIRQCCASGIIWLNIVASCINNYIIILWLNASCECMHHWLNASVQLSALHQASIWLNAVHQLINVALHHASIWLNPLHHGSILCIHVSMMCIRHQYSLMHL